MAVRGKALANRRAYPDPTEPNHSAVTGLLWDGTGFWLRVEPLLERAGPSRQTVDTQPLPGLYPKAV